MTSSHVVPAYPFEGALFWFLANGAPHSMDNSYYRGLYGEAPAKLAARAAAISSLYPEIILAPADVGLPAYNPELRISHDWIDNEWSEENRAVAEAAMRLPATRKFLNESTHLSGDKRLQEHFLCRTSMRIRIATRTNATLLGNTFFRNAYSFVAPWVRELLGEATTPQVPTSKIAIDETTLEVVGLEFAPASVDAFAAIRSSHEISKYAEGFRAAIEDASTHDNLEKRLRQLMTEAMDSSDVANRASGVFQTSSSLMTAVGLVPILGAAASAVGAVTDVAAWATGAVAKRKEWFLLGPKLHEIAIRHVLRRGNVEDGS